MAVAEELQIIIDAKVTAAVRDLKKVQGQIDNTSKASTKMTNVFKQLAGPLAIGAVIAGALKIGNEFSKLASNAEEVNSKFSAVFKDQTQAVDRWAKEFSDDIGRSVVDTKAFLSTIQDTFVPLGFARDAAADMSKEIVTLATDLSSFNNLPTETVVRDLQSALVGNTETLRKYGVVANETAIKQEALSSGVWDGEKAITAQEKAQAILNLTLKGTVDAQGDALRTAESSANVTRRLESAYKDFGAVVGDTINSAFTPLKSALAGLLTAATDYLAKQKEINEIQANLGDGTEIVSKNIEALESQLVKEAEILAEMTAFMGNAAEATGELDDETKSLLTTQKERVATLREHLVNLNRELSALEDLKAAREATTFTTTKMTEATEEQTEAVIEAIEAVETEIADYDILRQVLIDAENAFGKVGGAVGEVSEAVKELTIDYEDMAKTAASAFASTFKEVGEGNKTLWEGVKDGAKDAISAILESYAQLWIAQAAASFATGNFLSGTGLIAAAGGAYAASGLVQSFPVGGKFTTTGEQMIKIGDNASGQEEVTVTPKGGSSGGREMITVVIDGEQFKGYMQKQIDNRGLRSSRGGAI